ncbi:MAG: hypothetical protein J0I49_12215 [Pseudonocardia sp.]|uniref:hypothetical protein n=1 Tax=Pseudonocardia sp. TaxID=60912 RepID=UPI001AD3D593|nr:hypothetical protein [Pseudonocardia sp.]MBN9098859.1 hypothetical protein [Pseudonocardia sp.]
MSTPTRRLSLSVDAHVCAQTEIEARIHPSEDRVVIALNGHGICDVHLYAKRAELARLRDAMTTALADLDTTRTALAAELTDSQDAA